LTLPAESMPTNGTLRRHALAVVGTWAFAALVLVLPSGCRDKASTSSVGTQGGKRQQQDELRRRDQADRLFKVASTQLNDLASAVNIEIKPPTIILDSRSSADKQDVFAICAANPTIPNAPANIIHVPGGNARFKGLGVRQGDILKYFIIEDRTVDEDSRRAGLSKQKAMEFKVAFVLDDNTLVVENGLAMMNPFPAKIEIWRQVNDRLQDIHEKLNLYEVYRKPPIAWEPAPDEQVLNQVLAWLNQWIRQTETPAGWKPDPLLETLPAELTADKQLAELISPRALTVKSFTASEGGEGATIPKKSSDGRVLQEAVWLRDIARWAHGSGFDDLSRATTLFDWTIRNVDLLPDGAAPAYRPWHVLAHGHGTAEQRAWVFAQLCRQQGLDVVMLGVPASNPEGDKSSNGSGTYWLAALFSKGQLFLFDTRLGLPIPAADGKGVATLEQAMQDDSILRKLDLDGMPYPVTADALKNSKFYIVADPFELSTRAMQVEAALSGDDHVTLTVKPSEIAAKLKAIPGVGSVAIWDLPFRTLRDQLNLGKSARHGEALAFEPFAVRPALWKARARQFQGRRKANADAGGDAGNDHQDARRLYMSRSVRPTAAKIAATESIDEQRIDAAAKLNATYWLGLLSFDDGKPEVAADWLSRAELIAPNSPWIHGAKYNLARSLEAQGKLEEAINLLENDKSPQQHGNKLRARELKSRPQPKKEAKEATP